MVINVSFFKLVVGSSFVVVFGFVCLMLSTRPTKAEFIYEKAAALLPTLAKVLIFFPLDFVLAVFDI